MLVAGYDQHQQAAHGLLTNRGLARALDIHQEPEAVRIDYRINLFGQSLLAARRVIEEGFVSVFWNTYSHFAIGWDTHSNHYPCLKQFLLPVFDHSLPALLRDMESRGLLDETLVLCLSEHGRTSQLNNRPGNGREHWSRVYSACLVGAEIGRAQVVGESDKIGGDVKSDPRSPKDILASAFHLLGIDPNTTILDPLGRPVPVAGEGAVRHKLFRVKLPVEMHLETLRLVGQTVFPARCFVATKTAKRSVERLGKLSCLDSATIVFVIARV